VGCLLVELSVVVPLRVLNRIIMSLMARTSLNRVKVSFFRCLWQRLFLHFTVFVVGFFALIAYEETTFSFTFPFPLLVICS